MLKLFRGITALILLLVFAPASGLASSGEEEGASQGQSIVEGMLTQVSPLPDARTSPYPDCLFSTTLQTHATLSGPTLQHHIIVIFEGFKDRKMLSTSKLKEGDRIRVTLLPFSEVALDIQRKQRADEIDDFELDLFYALDVEIIDAFSSQAPPSPAPNSKTSAPSSSARDIASTSANKQRQGQTLKEGAAEELAPKRRAKKKRKARRITVEYHETPADRELIRMLRAEAIRHDKEVIDQALQRHGGSFDSWKEELEPLEREFSALSGNATVNGTRFFYYTPIWKEKDYSGPADTLIAMDREMKERGIDLIVVPNPKREAIYPDAFSDKVPSDHVVNVRRLQLFRTLLEADVEVMDLRPYYFEHRDDHGMLFYASSNEHPADGAIRLAAEAVSARLSRYNFLGSPKNRQSFVYEDSQFIASKEMNMSVGQAYPCTRVLDWDHKPVHPPSASPLLIVGDSHTGVPQSYGCSSANLVAQISSRLGFVPMHKLVAGGAPYVMRYLAQQGENYLKGRRVVLFFFSDYFLTLGNSWIAVNWNRQFSLERVFRDASFTHTLSVSRGFDGIQLKDADSKPTEHGLAITPTGPVPEILLPDFAFDPQTPLYARLALFTPKVSVQKPRKCHLEYASEHEIDLNLVRGWNSYLVKIPPHRPAGPLVLKLAPDLTEFELQRVEFRQTRSSEEGH